ncbi:MAG: Tat pathway signal sequence, partial [Coriobacteriia bacterium]|nr:Tat pathway signal sequence [Coriobacteriia bacterium]
ATCDAEALKDGAGLVKKYAMVNIQQYQNVAVGDTVAETQENYVKLLAEQGMLDDETAQQAVTQVSAQASGTIATMAQGVVDGNSHFYVTLEGDESGVIYDFALPGLLPIVTYQVGDDIEFSYAEPEDGAATRTVTAFADANATGTAQDGEVSGSVGSASADAGASATSDGGATA